MRRVVATVLLYLLVSGAAGAESFRTMVAGRLDISSAHQESKALQLGYIDSAVIVLDADRRFLRGVEIELKVPQAYQKYRGSVAIALYTATSSLPASGVADVEADRVGFELLPNKLQVVYQVPLRKDHGLKASPYVSLPTGVLSASSFPLVFRLMPVMKGLPEELEGMKFQFSAKPIVTDKGALRLVPKYPEKLKDRPFTLLIDDDVVDDPGREQILTEGEHRASLISEDYRNENRLFMIERGKVQELVVDLKDPTPVVSVEAPENAAVYFDDTLIQDPMQDFNTEPGEHVVRFVVGDYSIMKSLTVRKGRTYRVSISIDVDVAESD